jgi:SNF2 family DNA or RNA helicase
MGLGKTAQAIVACGKAKSSRILVLCPNTLKGHWAGEIEKWAPGWHVSVLRGSRQKKSRTIKEFRCGFLVANIEAARRPRIKKDGKTIDSPYCLVDDLLAARWDVLIVDEAHSVKNRKSSQTKGVTRLAAKTERVFLLTGTPIMNRIDELWSPLHILRPYSYPSYWSFVRRHTVVYQSTYGWVVDGKPTRPEELRREIAPLFLRREKEEVFPDMPPKIYQKVWLDMEGEQLRIYQDIEHRALAEIDDDTTVITAGILAQLTRCKQVAVSPGLVGGKPDGVKIDALMDILYGTHQKVLVFSQFAEAIKLVEERLKAEDINHVVLIGETREGDRDGIVKRFQTEPKVRVFLTTTQAGGCGITLTAASLVVFLDKHWTPAVNEQAVDRTRPHMQKRSVQIIELLTRDSVDGMIEGVLGGKVSIIEAIINKKGGDKG